MSASAEANAFLLEASKNNAPVSFDPNTGEWELTADFEFDTKYGLITIHAGFRFDLASIPRPLWPLLSPNELSVEAALLHDALYRRGGKLTRREYAGPVPGKSRPAWGRYFTRAEADRLFLEEMKAQGIWWWRRRAAYVAVRIFGGSSWKGA